MSGRHPDPSFCHHAPATLRFSHVNPAGSNLATSCGSWIVDRGSWIGRTKEPARKSIIESLDGESMPRQWYRRGIAPVTAPATVRGRIPLSGDLESNESRIESRGGTPVALLPPAPAPRPPPLRGRGGEGERKGK